MGWSNGNTLFWIGQADAAQAEVSRRRCRLSSLFRLRSRADVDALNAFLRDELQATIVDPAGEYYHDYYAVFFLDP